MAPKPPPEPEPAAEEESDPYESQDIACSILDDLVAVVSPRYMQIEGDFYVRGGIRTVVTVTHEA